MSSTRFTQQHIIELNEKPASSLLMNKELQNIYKGTNELDDEAKIHRAKQADPTLADTATEKHVTNAQTKKWEDTANTFSGVSPSSFVAATDVVTTATANKILKLNADGKLPTDIVGNATTATTASDSLLLNGKSDTAFQEVAEKDQPGGYAGLDANGLLPSAKLNPDVYKMGNILGTVSQLEGVPTGAIIERGSNANGEYVKFADGTLICIYHSAILIDSETVIGSMYKSSLEALWTFPSTFANNTYVISACNDGNAQSHWVSCRPDSTSAGAYSVFSPVASVGRPVKLFAIGRWF